MPLSLGQQRSAESFRMGCVTLQWVAPTARLARLVGASLLVGNVLLTLRDEPGAGTRTLLFIACVLVYLAVSGAVYAAYDVPGPWRAGIFFVCGALTGWLAGLEEPEWSPESFHMGCVINTHVAPSVHSALHLCGCRV
jgi:hypothetical protein